MEYLTQWITNIILFILLATVIDMLLPSSSMQKYVKLVISLLLISVILSPILKIFSSDFESAIAAIPSFQGKVTNENIENSVEMQKKEIQASHHAYILEQTAVQLELEAEEELMEQYGMKIANIELEADEMDEPLSPENLQSIKVEIESHGDESKAVAVVKEVEIDTAEPLPSEQNLSNIKGIAALLSEKWNVPKSSIDLVIEGGT